MKKLLTIAAIFTLSLGLGAISLAQDAGPQGGQLEGKRRMGQRPGGGLRMMEKMQKEVLATLTLTDAQKKKIDDLNKELVEKMKAARKGDKGTPGNEKDKAAIKKIRGDYDKDLQAILGADNWKKYREGMLAKMKEAREKRKEGQGKP